VALPGPDLTRRRKDGPRLAPQWLALLMGVPLAWAVLLLFHGPGPSDAGVYESLRDEASSWLIVHVGSVLFVGLMGAALYLLVRDMPGVAARVSRLAIGPFVLFYAAGEAILGVATGVLVEHADDVPAGQRGPAADAAQALYDSNAGELLKGVGAVAWVLAVIAAAVAYHRVGAPLAVSTLLGLSAIAALHAPPTGPLGLLFFAGAVALLAYSQRPATAVEEAAPA
jgi:hypothetical protein